MITQKESLLPYPAPLICVLIRVLLFCVALVLPTGFSLSGFQTKNLHAFLLSPMLATSTDHLIVLDSEVV